MTDTDKLKYLKLSLVVFGIIFIIGMYPLTVNWSSHWPWNEGQSLYLHMILGIYVVLGISLLIAAKNPLEHKSLIWFTIFSCIAHSGIKAAQALAYPELGNHFYGDIPLLLAIAIVLSYLMLGKSTTK